MERYVKWIGILVAIDTILTFAMIWLLPHGYVMVS